MYQYCIGPKKGSKLVGLAVEMTKQAATHLSREEVIEVLVDMLRPVREEYGDDCIDSLVCDLIEAALYQPFKSAGFDPLRTIEYSPAGAIPDYIWDDMERKAADDPKLLESTKKLREKKTARGRIRITSGSEQRLE